MRVCLQGDRLRQLVKEASMASETNPVIDVLPVRVNRNGLEIMAIDPSNVAMSYVWLEAETGAEEETVFGLPAQTVLRTAKHFVEPSGEACLSYDEDSKKIVLETKWGVARFYASGVEERELGIRRLSVQEREFPFPVSGDAEPRVRAAYIAVLDKAYGLKQVDRFAFKTEKVLRAIAYLTTGELELALVSTRLDDTGVVAEYGYDYGLLSAALRNARKGEELVAFVSLGGEEEYAVLSICSDRGDMVRCYYVAPMI